MDQPCRPLIEVLAEIPDPRHARGKRYPLTPVLALACVAMLCGDRSYSASVEWGRNYGGPLRGALGFAGTRAVRGTPVPAFPGAGPGGPGRGAGPLGGGGPGRDAGTRGGGRGARRRRQGRAREPHARGAAPGAHLLSLVSQRLGLTMAQAAVDDKTTATRSRYCRRCAGLDDVYPRAKQATATRSRYCRRCAAGSCSRAACSRWMRC